MIFFIDYSLKSHYSFIFATSLPVLFKITVFDQLVFKYMVYLHCKNFRTFQTLDPFILVEPVFFFSFEVCHRSPVMFVFPATGDGSVGAGEVEQWKLTWGCSSLLWWTGQPDFELYSGPTGPGMF